jgi:hypothetical protein
LPETALFALPMRDVPQTKACAASFVLVCRQAMACLLFYTVTISRAKGVRLW